MTPHHFHPYVSRIVRVAPHSAGAVLDFARWCLSAPDTADRDEDRGWCVTTPAGRLRVGGRFQRAVPRPRGYWPLRVTTGMLHPAGRGARPVAVTLELLPWSSRWSELALTAGPLRWADRRADAWRSRSRHHRRRGWPAWWRANRCRDQKTYPSLVARGATADAGPGTEPPEPDREDRGGVGADVPPTGAGPEWAPTAVVA